MRPYRGSTHTPPGRAGNAASAGTCTASGRSLKLACDLTTRRIPMHGRIAGAAIGAGVTLMLAAPAAGAATRTVEAGPFGAAVGKFEAATGDANMYFRRVIKVHKGDKITWHMNGFHSVTFQPEGDPAPSLVAPDPAHPV